MRFGDFVSDGIENLFVQFLLGCSLRPALVLFNKCVVSILDHMLCPSSIEQLRNHGPFGAIPDDRFDQLKVFEVSPLGAIDFRGEIIEPSLSAFLSSPEELFL